MVGRAHQNSISTAHWTNRQSEPVGKGRPLLSNSARDLAAPIRRDPCLLARPGAKCPCHRPCGSASCWLPDSYCSPRRSGYTLGIEPYPSEATALTIEYNADTLRGHSLLHLIGKENNRPRYSLHHPFLCGPPRPPGLRAAVLRPIAVRRAIVGTSTAWSPGSDATQPSQPLLFATEAATAATTPDVLGWARLTWTDRSERV